MQRGRYPPTIPAAASVLRNQTGFDWLARDVEMAAFQDEGSRSPLLPPLTTIRL